LKSEDITFRDDVGAVVWFTVVLHRIAQIGQRSPERVSSSFLVTAWPEQVGNL